MQQCALSITVILGEFTYQTQYNSRSRDTSLELILMFLLVISKTYWQILILNRRTFHAKLSSSVLNPPSANC